MNYNYEQYKKNTEILNGMEKVLKKIGKENEGREFPVSFEIRGRDGNLTKVSKEEFAWWMVNEKGKDSWVGGVFGLEPKNPEIEGQKKELKEIEDAWKNWDDEWKQTKEKWQKTETELGIPDDSIKHSWRSWNNDGSIGEEIMLFESENQSQLITFEKKGTNSPQIREITDEKTEQIKDENSLIQNKKDQWEENSIQSDKNQALVKDKNNNFSLPTKITIGSGIILTPIMLVCIVRKWKNK